MARAQRREGELGTTAKSGPFDLVTAADRAIERYLRNAIARRFPGHAIAGEEYGSPATLSPWLWVLDPIDGTFNFATGLPAAGTSIGLMHEGKVRVGGVADLYTGEVAVGRVGEGAWHVTADGTRRHLGSGRAGAPRLFLECGVERLDDWLLDGFREMAAVSETVPRLIGSAAVALAAVAREGGCFVGVGLSAWDVVGGAGLAEASGLSVTWWHEAFPGVHVLVADAPTRARLEPMVARLAARWRRERGLVTPRAEAAGLRRMKQPS